MKATILTVGTEILFGSITNTNAVFLSRELQTLGIDVMYHITVGDNPGRLKEILGHIYEDCDMIITTGGLGPTQDDLTKETVAEYFCTKNIFHYDEYELIKDKFNAMHRPMTPNNDKQAFFPEGSIILANPNGTAPGFILEKNEKIIISMPGPPREMIPMFNNHVKPWLLSKQNAYLYYKTLRTIDIGESQLETDLMSLIDGQSNPTLATYAKDFEATLRIASKCDTRKEAESAVEEMTEKVKDILGDKVYSDNDDDIDYFVVNKLIKMNLSISSAESMTGGAFASSVTQIPNASKILSSAFITYSNEEKCRLLGVNPETIEKFSVVSAEVAKEMAKGLSEKTRADIAISVTGYAGPSGDDVGLYYIGLYFKGKLIAVKRKSKADRGRSYVIANAVRDMFVLIYKECIT